MDTLTIRLSLICQPVPGRSGMPPMAWCPLLGLIEEGSTIRVARAKLHRRLRDQALDGHGLTLEEAFDLGGALTLGPGGGEAPRAWEHPGDDAWMEEVSLTFARPAPTRRTA